MSLDPYSTPLPPWIATAGVIYIFFKSDSLFFAGGLILLVGNEGFLEANLEYKGRLEPYMKQLETEGKWILLEKTVVPKYHSAANGLLFVFRVTK